MAFAETLVVLSLLFKMGQASTSSRHFGKRSGPIHPNLAFLVLACPPSQPEAHSYEDVGGTFPSCLIFVHLREERSLQQRCQRISSLVTILAWRPYHSQIVQLYLFWKKNSWVWKVSGTLFLHVIFFKIRSWILKRWWWVWSWTPSMKVQETAWHWSEVGLVVKSRVGAELCMCHVPEGLLSSTSLAIANCSFTRK